MELLAVPIRKPDSINFILGQAHFVKTVEDLHEALVGVVPGIRFGLAFCEASGDCLIRWSGTDEAMIALAKENAEAIGAGHSFIIFLGEGFFPLSVLNSIKSVPGLRHLLRHRQSGAGHGGSQRKRPRHPRGDRRRSPALDRGRDGDRRAQSAAAQVWLQAVGR
jgi:hypothetical protein